MKDIIIPNGFSCVTKDGSLCIFLKPQISSSYCSYSDVWIHQNAQLPARDDKCLKKDWNQVRVMVEDNEKL